MSWLLHPVTHCLSFYPHIPFVCSVHSQDNEHQSGWTSLYWSQRRPMACWYLKHVKNYQEIPSGCALFFFFVFFLMLDQLMILLVFITSYISPLCREQPVFLRALLSVTRQTVARATGGAWWERARRFQLVTGPCPSLLSLQVPRRAMLSTY